VKQNKKLVLEVKKNIEGILGFLKNATPNLSFACI
jgi:hypothetical protein